MKKYYFGRYIHKNSLIHRLNPIVKLFFIAFLIGAAALSYSPIRLASVFILLCILLALSKITPKEFWPSLRSFRFLLLFTFFIQLFFSYDGKFVLKPAEATVLNSIFITLRFSFIIAFSAVYTLTTAPADIAKALYFFIRPFGVFKINVKDAAVSILVAIRFIPLLFEESNKIITAQKLRGLWNGDTSFRDKFRFFIKAESFMIPLFMRVIYYAEQISITLCYRQNLEKVMAAGRPRFSDILFLISAAMAFWGVYALR